jgi:hypothetical protein
MAKKFLGTAKTVIELFELLHDYTDFNLYLEGCNYDSPYVDVVCDEEEKYIELN